MARFCVVVVTAVCCIVAGFYGDDAAAETRECSVKRSGVLTMFNGQTSTVAVPCKYRLAGIQCGDYHLRVTPGSQLDSYNTFSPYSVFVRMQKTGLAGYMWVQTTSRRLQKFAGRKVGNPWQVKRGNLSSFGLDLAGFDSAKKASVLRKDGVFEVEFSADQASVVVRCFSDSFSTPQPDTLCGDGEPGDAVTKEEILDMVFTNNEVVQRPRPSCPRAVLMYQQCNGAVNNTRSCSEVLLKQATVDCLAASGTSLIDHYHRCLAVICDGDASALDPTLAYIEHNCALGPGSDCSNDLLGKCDSQSTCEGGAICKRKLEQPCAGFKDHCVDGTTCDPDTNICTATANTRVTLDPGSDCSNDLLGKCDSQSTCEGGAICKRKLEQPCAGFRDHCVMGTTCDPYINICTITANTKVINWLNKPCRTDRECPAAQSTCFEALCLCTPGYFYSVGRNTCVKECAPWDRWTNFLKYPGSYVNGNKLEEAYKASAEDCLQWCLKVRECRTADYYLSLKLCVIQDITALDGYVSDWITGSSTDSTHYQVMCA